MHRLRVVFILGFALLVALSSRRLFATVLPAGFTEVVVASGLDSPTSFTFTPDGRMLITLKGGAVRVVKNQVLLATPAITLAVSSQSERGALGITVDPQFASNQRVYIYYTTSSGSFQPPGHPYVSPKNRVSRFTMSGDLITPASQVVILDDIASDAGNHNGGWVQFGPDGKLYISTGDGGQTAQNSQSLSNLSGKILRINADGSVPPDNPFISTPGARDEIFCYGLRNPWRNAFDSAGRLFIGDVGSNKFEEINLGGAGLNYGWPVVEGIAGNPGFVDPIYAYAHGSGASITVGAFSSSFVYPSQYSGVLFFGDFVQSFIRTLRYNASSGTATVSSFGSGADGPVHFLSGQDGLMYYASINTGQIQRLDYPLQTNGTPAPADYDADGRDDFAIFRKPSEWLIWRSSDGVLTSTNWGSVALGDKPVPADYDGDDLADIAVYRPNTSTWRIRKSAGGSIIQVWGAAAMKDLPAQGDYDGDGVTDLAVYSSLNARWLIKWSSDGTTINLAWGAPALGDAPVPRDYDGDGRTDIAVFRTSTGEWFIRRSLGPPWLVLALGQAGDTPVPADYDGDGLADAAVFRMSNANWIIRRSSDQMVTATAWGAPSLGDVPAQADYDGDGKTDIAVYRRSTGQWFVLKSTGGSLIFP